MSDLGLKVYESYLHLEIPSEGRPNRKFRKKKFGSDWFGGNFDLSEFFRINDYNPAGLEQFAEGNLIIGKFVVGNPYWEFVRGENQRVWYRQPDAGLLGQFGFGRDGSSFLELKKGDFVYLRKGDELAVQAIKRPNVDLFVILKVKKVLPSAPMGINTFPDYEVTQP